MINELIRRLYLIIKEEDYLPINNFIIGNTMFMIFEVKDFYFINNNLLRKLISSNLSIYYFHSYYEMELHWDDLLIRKH